MKHIPPLCGTSLKRGKRCSLSLMNKIYQKTMLRACPAFVSLCLLFLALPLSPARADFTYGDLSLSGNLQTQQIFRHPEPDKWSIIQQRNVIRRARGI